MSVKLDIFLQDNMGFFTCLECEQTIMTKPELSMSEIELKYQEFWDLHKACEEK